ncbi:MAG: hypothetical protein K0S36_2597 [Nitrosospira multiformis]|jgi:putative SOS response-associated peptidase YedK|nr:hypothetical protein [Nitrosospira multiformis]
MPFSFAGLWETWVTDTGEAKESCAIITTECNELMQPIHDRMPVILASEAWDAWLDPGFRKDEILLSLLKPFDADRMQAWPVSAAVGKVMNQGEELFYPLIQSQLEAYLTLDESPVFFATESRIEGTRSRGFVRGVANSR